MINSRFILPVLFSMLFTSVVGIGDLTAQSVGTRQQVRSLLSNKCFACHGPDQQARQSDLRLDTFEGATDFAITPRAPEDSDLMERITSNDPNVVMPPPGFGKPLTKDQQDLVRDWISDGAVYAKHWSYEKPARPDTPVFKLAADRAWIQNDIDRFALTRIKQQGLSPAPPADRAAILRRLALDLTGLPPTIEELQQFIADDSPDSYEKQVDEYLQRPAYGERWAAMWLDLARYADSAGYAEDRKRTIWAYRDYVIRAYNKNLSFDEFTREQIAGDLIPNATEEQKIATAFHRNTLTNSEGGTSDEEFRSAAIVDRTNTTFAVWMGTTMACAQCHTHKYDPITQEEYFQIYAFFNQTADNDRPNEAPLLKILSQDQRSQQKELTAKIEQLERSGQAKISTEQFSAWKKKTIARMSRSAKTHFVRVELLKTGKDRLLSLAEVQVFSRTKKDDSTDTVTNVAIKGTATQSSTGFNGPAELAIDGNTSGEYTEGSVTHTENEKQPWWQIELAESYPVDSIVIWNRTDGNLQSRLDGFRVLLLDSERKRIWSDDFAQAPKRELKISPGGVPDSIAEILNQPEPATKEQIANLKAFANEQRDLEIKSQIADLQRQLDQLNASTTVPIMEELPNSKRRETKIQIRGNFADLGAMVTAATPAAFHSLNKQPRDKQLDRKRQELEKPNRMSLANWLVDPSNPLTARVVANRYWEQLFGRGLVATSEEFGAQGELPTHPELLDWLAVELTENQWDTRALLKTMVMSSTYRQSSRTSDAQNQIDPGNRWLARGPRVRLTAEMIRDQALAVSGLLSNKMYGPPVQPPQPKVGLKPAFSGRTTDWKDSTGEDRYRRAIYTEWRRSAPYPSMATFDMNNREVCEVRRSQTNTPLQALVTLNDPVYVEAAQALARRMMAFAGQSKNDDGPNRVSDQQIAEFGFRCCLIRKPAAAELDRLVRLFRSTREHFSTNVDSARLLATDPLQTNDQFDVVDLAAWTTVANVLLNLDEIFMKR